jgi:hypothetical protein
MVQFANAISNAPGEYFSGIKIIIVERNAFFSVVSSVVEPLSSLEDTEALGNLLGSRVMLAEVTAQSIRRTFLGESGDLLHAGSLVGKLRPSTATIQYCRLFCAIGDSTHKRPYKYATLTDASKTAPHASAWDRLYNFLGVDSEVMHSPEHSPTCSERTPVNIVFETLQANATRLRTWAVEHSSSWAPILVSALSECSMVSHKESSKKVTSFEMSQSSSRKDNNDYSSLRVLHIITTVHAPLLSSTLRDLVNKLRPGNTTSDVGRKVLAALRQSMRIRNSGEFMDSTEVQKDIFSKRKQMKSSSFIDFPEASDKFCDDNSDPSVSGPPLKTAVCLVGVPRTMIRPDVRDSFLHRFLAGWGLRSLSVFAVLVDTGSGARHAEVFAQLSRFNTVAAEWYRETVTEDKKGQRCPDNNEVKQLKQWSRCMTMIEAREQKDNVLFDAVVKIRPDDLWYGAMPPYCALNLKTNAYISRQQKRWSDQWFALPRNLAQVFMHAVQTGLTPYCDHQRKPFFNNSKIRRSGSLPYEEMIFEFLKTQAMKQKVHITSLLLPRILTRQKDSEEGATKHTHIEKNTQDMCQRFKWYLGSDDCLQTVLGTKKYMTSLTLRRLTVSADRLDCANITSPPPPFGFSMIYLRRMRKAGSTSIYQGLKHGMKDRLPTVVEVHGEEQMTLNRHCLASPMSPAVLFVTHLRDPIKRIISEFHFAGPGGKKAGRQPAVEATWLEWRRSSFEQLYSVNGNHSGVLHGGSYIDNLYTRALTGSCGICQRNKKLHLLGCFLVGRHGRSPRLAPITNAEETLASEILLSFHLVIILELLGDPQHMAHIRRVVGLPDSFKFSHARNDVHAHNSDSGPPPAIIQTFLSENRPDIMLYEKWRQKVRCGRSDQSLNQ